MKLPYKGITVIILLAIASVLAMQAYWLTGLYRSMMESKENAIERSIREADNQELFARINEVKKNYPDKSLVSYGQGGKDQYKISALVNLNVDSMQYYSTVETTQTKVFAEKKGNSVIVADSGKFKSSQKDSASVPNQATIGDFTLEIQRGLHFAVHKLGIEVNLRRFDYLLTQELAKDNITAPHYTQIVNLDKKSIVATNAPVKLDPSRFTIHQMIYDDVSDRLAYRIYMKPTNKLVLEEMTGVFSSSLLIVVILCIAFWYLIHVMRRMKSVDEMKEDFTHNITHELKTPIAVAYAANDALLNFSSDIPASERNKKYLNIIQEQLKHLSGLVEQILSMNMEQRRGFVLNHEDIALKSLIDELISRHKLKAEKDVDFAEEIIPENLTVRADRLHLYNMISNLIDNAVKYSPAPAWISIKALNYHHNIYISVADRGPGIEKDKQNHVFDKFYRVPQGNRHDVKGYGLGLYYVKTLAEKHHGEVTLESTPGKGSIFTLILPEK